MVDATIYTQISQANGITKSLVDKELSSVGLTVKDWIAFGAGIIGSSPSL